jgi:peroxiredoxin
VQYLVGRRLPDVELPATSGSSVNPGRLKGLAVLFCYPWTGRPGHPNPPHWDEIPGAHGSTPQAVAYSEAYGKFRKLGVGLFGISLQDSEWQREFVQRQKLAYRLLSDIGRKFSGDLGLQAFTTGGIDYLQRLTLITNNGIITTARFPVPSPEKDASEVLDLLQAR